MASMALTEAGERARRARKRRALLESAVVDGVVSLILAPLRGWCLMLAIDLIHTHWIAAVPPIGFWWATLIPILLVAALSPARSSRRREN